MHQCISTFDACHGSGCLPHKGKLWRRLARFDHSGWERQCFPAALGIAESENEATWTWFVENVRNAFGIDDGGNGLVFISDREKGIDIAIRRLVPNASHAYCVYHIQKNVKVKFKTTLDGLLFAAANAFDVKSFREIIEKIKALNHEAGKYVESIDPTKWARAFFDQRRYGHVTSNISESMNWWLEDARHMDPVGLFGEYVRKMNSLFERRRQKYAAMTLQALPKRVEMLLNESIDQSRKLRVFKHSQTIFEVQRITAVQMNRVVDLGSMTCSCGFLKEFGVPCRHMCAAIMSLRQHPQTFVIPERRMECVKAIYDHATIPVDDSTFEDDGLKAPLKTKKRGRPKKNRIPSPCEKPPRKKVKCGRCHGVGHNSRTCKAKKEYLNALKTFSLG